MRAVVWDVSGGYILANDIRMTVWEAPVIPGIPRFRQLRYRPELDERLVNRNGDWQPLSPAECNVLDAWLTRWAKSCRESVRVWDGRTERRQSERRALEKGVEE